MRALLSSVLMLALAQWGMGPGPGTPAGGGASPGPPSTNLLAWYKADSLSASPVTAWADSSTNGKNLVTGAAGTTWAAAQINGLPAVTFIGSSWLAQTTGGIPYSGSAGVSIYVVWKPTTTTGSGGIIGNYLVTNAFEYYVDSVPGKAAANASGTAVLGTSSTALASGVWKISTVTYVNSGALAFYLDGVADGTANTSSSISNNINAIGDGNGGFADFFNGSVAEILIYNSNTYQPAVYTYLHGRYPSA